VAVASHSQAIQHLCSAQLGGRRHPTGRGAGSDGLEDLLLVKIRGGVTGNWIDLPACPVSNALKQELLIALLRHN
jgi:hypothetical protein